MDRLDSSARRCPRRTRDALYGELSFAYVYVALFGILATYGTSEFLTKTLARDTGSTGHYVYNTLVIKLIASLLVSGLAIGLGFVLRFDAQRMALVGVYCIGMVLTVLNNVLIGGLQALQRMGRPALWNAISLYVGAILGIILLFGGAGVVAYALAFNLALIIPVIGNAIGLRAELRTHREPDRRVWRHVVFGGFPFFVMSGLLAVYGSVDIPMIEAFDGTEAVGWYALAYRWVSMPAFFAAAVATAFFPALSAEGGKSRMRSSRWRTERCTSLLFAVPAAIGIGLIATDFISLVYGSDFQQAAPLMQLLSLHIPIVGLDIVLGTVVVAADRQRQWVTFSAVAAMFNPLANLLAIPLAIEWFDNGAIGTAFTTVLTELILMTGAL